MLGQGGEFCKYSTVLFFFFFFSSRRRHTRWNCDWSSTCALPISFSGRFIQALRCWWVPCWSQYRIRYQGRWRIELPAGGLSKQQPAAQAELLKYRKKQIGRASCRERV